VPEFGLLAYTMFGDNVKDTSQIRHEEEEEGISYLLKDVSQLQVVCQK